MWFNTDEQNSIITKEKFTPKISSRKNKRTFRNNRNEQRIQHYLNNQLSQGCDQQSMSKLTSTVVEKYVLEICNSSTDI